MFAPVLDRGPRVLIPCGMSGRQFIARVRRWARHRELRVRFVASHGAGSHGTLYVGDRRTTVKDRKKEIGKGLLHKMLSDLGIDSVDFRRTDT